SCCAGAVGIPKGRGGKRESCSVKRWLWASGRRSRRQERLTIWLKKIFCRAVLGFKSSWSSAVWVWKASWHSEGRQARGLLRPFDRLRTGVFLRAFLEERVFPLGDLGPVDLSALARLAARRRGEICNLGFGISDFRLEISELEVRGWGIARGRGEEPSPPPSPGVPGEGVGEESRRARSARRMSKDEVASS